MTDVHCRVVWKNILPQAQDETLTEGRIQASLIQGPGTMSMEGFVPVPYGVL